MISDVTFLNSGAGLHQKIKLLEERLHNAVRDSKKGYAERDSVDKVLEQERRMRADSDQRINRLEQDKRKLELQRNDATRNTEEYNKKMISYESELSHLKAKV